MSLTMHILTRLVSFRSNSWWPILASSSYSWRAVIKRCMIPANKHIPQKISLCRWTPWLATHGFQNVPRLTLSGKTISIGCFVRHIKQNDNGPTYCVVMVLFNLPELTGNKCWGLSITREEHTCFSKGVNSFQALGGT